MRRGRSGRRRDASSWLSWAVGTKWSSFRECGAEPEGVFAWPAHELAVFDVVIGTIRHCAGSGDPSQWRMHRTGEGVSFGCSELPASSAQLDVGYSPSGSNSDQKSLYAKRPILRRSRPIRLHL